MSVRALIGTPRHEQVSPPPPTYTSKPPPRAVRRTPYRADPAPSKNPLLEHGVSMGPHGWSAHHLTGKASWACNSPLSTASTGRHVGTSPDEDPTPGRTVNSAIPRRPDRVPVSRRTTKPRNAVKERAAARATTQRHTVAPNQRTPAEGNNRTAATSSPSPPNATAPPGKPAGGKGDDTAADALESNAAYPTQLQVPLNESNPSTGAQAMQPTHPAMRWVQKLPSHYLPTLARRASAVDTGPFRVAPPGSHHAKSGVGAGRATIHATPTYPRPPTTQPHAPPPGTTVNRGVTPRGSRVHRRPPPAVQRMRKNRLGHRVHSENGRVHTTHSSHIHRGGHGVTVDCNTTPRAMAAAYQRGGH